MNPRLLNGLSWGALALVGAFCALQALEWALLPSNGVVGGGAEYIDIGNCDTLAPPPSRAVILLTPCFLTSSMRRMECRGR